MDKQPTDDECGYIVYDKNQQGYVHLAWVMNFPVNENKTGTATFSKDLSPKDEELQISEMDPIIVSREAIGEIKKRYGRLAETDLIIYQLKQIFPT